MRLWASALAGLLAATPSGAQREAALSGPRASYPFTVGENLEFDAKLGILTLGHAALNVARIDTVRGQETYLFRFTVEGGTFFFKITSALESWAGTSDLVSRRFHTISHENDRTYQHTYEIYPDSGHFREIGHDTLLETPPEPLDEMAFFYFVRVTPLEVGKTYQYPRYFKKEFNPVTIKVLKREKMSLPDGDKVDCLLLNPVVGNQGFFAPRADARVWLTDDSRRLPVQIRSRQPWGVLTLELTGIGTTASSPPPGADSNQPGP